MEELLDPSDTILCWTKKNFTYIYIYIYTPILHMYMWIICIWYVYTHTHTHMQEEKGMTEDEMVGWHHRLNGHEFGWTLGVGDEQGSLVSCGPWGHKESDTAERLNWTDIYMKSYDQPKQHIKKQRHHFAYKGLYSQSYGFSSSHIWVWELDHKEGWVPKNWCFWTVVLEKTL